MMEYICYDGVDDEITYHDKKEEAQSLLQANIDTGFDGDEWMDGVEDSFVAEIITTVKCDVINEKYYMSIEEG